jgi:hypothetical protein
MVSLHRPAFAVLVVMASAAGAAAAPFRFTVTADSRSLRTQFRYTLAEMKRLVGNEGVFHVSPGDIDPPADNFADLVSAFGSGVIWYAGVGNHEAETAANMQWVRAHFPSLPFIVRQGPTGCENTTYSFDYGNAHFVMLNEYCDAGSDVGTDGDVADVLYNWLAADLAASTKPVKLVFGHEPAFPKGNHVGDSLDERPQTRDRFWSLLQSAGVQAYLCGHTHSYSTTLRPGTSLWQIDVGNAGNGSPLTFLDVTVSDSAVRFDAWQGQLNQPFALVDTWSVELDAGAPTVPEVSLLADAAEITEDSTQPAVLTFERSGDTSAALSVAVDLAGSASRSGANADVLLTPADGVVTFQPGESQAVMLIAPIDDAVVEGDETVTVSLRASAQYTLGPVARATLVIHDDDVAAPGGNTSGGGSVDGGSTPPSATSDPLPLPDAGQGSAPASATAAGDEPAAQAGPAASAPAAGSACSAVDPAAAALLLLLPLLALAGARRRRPRGDLEG